MIWRGWFRWWHGFSLGAYLGPSTDPLGTSLGFHYHKGLIFKGTASFDLLI